MEHFLEKLSANYFFGCRIVLARFLEKATKFETNHSSTGDETRETSSNNCIFDTEELKDNLKYDGVFLKPNSPIETTIFS